MSVRWVLDVLRHEGLIVTERGSPARIRQLPERTFLELADTDHLVARMPTRGEALRLRMPTGVPLLGVRHADGTTQTFPADRFGAHGVASR